MKKTVMFVFFILITISGLIFGIIQSINQDIDEIVKTILKEIPSSFDQTVFLPVSENDSYKISYYNEDGKIENYKIEYTPKLENSVIEIDLKIESYFIEKTYKITLIEERDPFYLYNEFINQAILEIDDSIPQMLTGHTNLIKPSNPDIQVTYTSDCVTILDTTILYFDEYESGICDINVSFFGYELQKEMTVNILIPDQQLLKRLPILTINTQDATEITDPDLYVNATATLSTENGDLILNPTDLGIRIRGNSSSVMPKLSYKIKFDEKQSLFEDYSEYDWVLIANFADQTLLRNYIAFELSSSLDRDFSPSTHFVDVFLNGEYHGVYLLTDQIEVTNDRVDIEENSANIDTGYLIELDRSIEWNPSNDPWFEIDSIPFVMKSPDYSDETYSEDQKEFIESYMQDIINTLKNQEDYSLLLNEQSFIDWFIVNEIMKNVDVGYSSVYYKKDAGGKLEMGPVWDFDLSSGNPGHLDQSLRGPEGFYTALENKNTLFFYLMQYDEFRNNLKARWNDIYETAILEMFPQLLEGYNLILGSRIDNFDRWDIIGENQDWYTAEEIYELKTYDDQFWFLYDYLEVRINWLNEAINDL
jgi:hypothetical protein